MYEIPKTVMIKNTTFTNTWALANYAVNKYGIIVPSGPNYTDNPDFVPPNIKEITACIEYGPDAIKQILNKQIHPNYPHQSGLDAYINQLIPGTEEFEHGRTFHYSYGLRLRERPKPLYDSCGWDIYTDCTGYDGYCKCRYYNEGRYTAGECYIDQLKFIAENLLPFNKRLQAITWVPEIDLPATIVDELKQSCPCLQRVKLENYYDKYYVAFLSWRSRDLYKAHQWNVVGLMNSIDQLIQESRERLGQPKLECAKVVEFIDSLHVYEEDWEKSAKVPIDVNTIEHCLFI